MKSNKHFTSIITNSIKPAFSSEISDLKSSVDTEFKKIREDIRSTNNEITKLDIKYSKDMDRVFHEFDDASQHHLEETNYLKEEIEILENLHKRSRIMNFVLSGIIIALMIIVALVK